MVEKQVFGLINGWVLWASKISFLTSLFWLNTKRKLLLKCGHHKDGIWSLEETWVTGKFPEWTFQTTGEFPRNPTRWRLFMVPWAQQRKIQGEGYKQTSPMENQDFKWPWKQIWRVKVPQKVACFTWLLSNEAVLTLENVARQVYLYATDAPYVVRIQRQ